MLSLFLLASSVAAFSASANNNIALYWGQNSAGGANTQQSLSYYCESDAADIMLISFLYEFPNAENGLPGLNIASNACGANIAGTDLPDCSALGTEIKKCQSLGKKVFISLGGASGSYGLSSTQQAQSFADTMWNIFGGGSSNTRPFGDAIIDGYDLDIEGGAATYYGDFVTQLRTHFQPGEYFISGAPQCPLPDAYINTAMTTSSFDFAFVQFYNNYCQVGSGSNFNFGDWSSWATSQSFNKDIKIYLGVPGSRTAAGTGYSPESTVAELAVNLQSNFANFGGVMIWDASQAWTNDDFAQGIKNALGSSAPPPANPPVTSSSSTSSSTSSTWNPPSTPSSSTTSTWSPPSTPSSSTTSTWNPPSTPSSSTTSTWSPPSTPSSSTTSTWSPPSTPSSSTTSTWSPPSTPSSSTTSTWSPPSAPSSSSTSTWSPPSAPSSSSTSTWSPPSTPSSASSAVEYSSTTSDSSLPNYSHEAAASPVHVLSTVSSQGKLISAAASSVLKSSKAPTLHDLPTVAAASSSEIEKTTSVSTSSSEILTSSKSKGYVQSPHWLNTSYTQPIVTSSVERESSTTVSVSPEATSSSSAPEFTGTTVDQTFIVTVTSIPAVSIPAQTPGTEPSEPSEPSAPEPATTTTAISTAYVTISTGVPGSSTQIPDTAPSTVPEPVQAAPPSTPAAVKPQAVQTEPIDKEPVYESSTPTASQASQPTNIGSLPEASVPSDAPQESQPAIPQPVPSAVGNPGTIVIGGQGNVSYHNTTSVNITTSLIASPQLVITRGNVVTSPTAPVASTIGPVPTGYCPVNGAMQCIGSGFITCDHNTWVVRECSPGSTCLSTDTGLVYCGWP